MKNFSKAEFLHKLNESHQEQRIEEAARGWNDIAKLITAAWKSAKIPTAYARDYVASLERMAQKNAKLFFKQYGDFTEEDFAEDMRYNMANESATINEATNTMAYKKARKLTAKDPGLVSDIKSDMTALRLKLGLDNNEKEWLSYIVTLATYGVGQGVWDEGSNESVVENEKLNEGKFAEWEVSFKAMNLSGTKLSPKNVYKVKARGTGEAIRKAAKEAGVKDDMWIATETNFVKKLG